MLATSTSKSEELNIWKTDQTCFNTSTHYSVLQNTFSLLLKSASFRKMTVSYERCLKHMEKVVY